MIELIIVRTVQVWLVGIVVTTMLMWNRERARFYSENIRQSKNTRRFAITLFIAISLMFNSIFWPYYIVYEIKYTIDTLFKRGL